ncbi:MAG TPA: RIP metalloprotease RseP [bacterium]|nr:RIP metalloprotease RseP [bacterium]
MTTILATIFVLGILIFIHESGHFLAAKLFGIRVDRFSMGYPPRLFGKKVGETDYCISAIPFGGYVKIAGMVDESMDTGQLSAEPSPWEFRSKPWISRFSVILAGPVMNLLLAYCIFVGGVFIYGIGEYSREPVIGQVAEAGPARDAGILPGDRIVSIDDVAVGTWEEMAQIVHASPRKPLSILIRRADSLITHIIVPKSETIPSRDGEREVGLIGIAPELLVRNASLVEGFRQGGDNFMYLTRLIVDVVGRLVTGKESVRSLAGPVAIARMAGESARSGFGTLFSFMAMLSLNLGILNLLPIPVLDGGHLLILGVEGVARRDLPLKAKLAIQQVFMFLLIGLMVFVVYNDITRALK